MSLTREGVGTQVRLSSKMGFKRVNLTSKIESDKDAYLWCEI
jgi:hypothetical protein